MVLDLINIERGCEYAQALSVERDTRVEKAACATKENDADVEKFATFDAWYTRQEWQR